MLSDISNESSCYSYRLTKCVFSTYAIEAGQTYVVACYEEDPSVFYYWSFQEEEWRWEYDYFFEEEKKDSWLSSYLTALQWKKSGELE